MSTTVPNATSSIEDNNNTPSDTSLLPPPQSSTTYEDVDDDVSHEMLVRGLFQSDTPSSTTQQQQQQLTSDESDDDITDSSVAPAPSGVTPTEDPTPPDEEEGTRSTLTSSESHISISSGEVEQHTGELPYLAAYLKKHPDASHFTKQHSSFSRGGGRYWEKPADKAVCWVCLGLHDSSVCSRKRCFRCAQEGHGSAECNSTLWCSTCRKQGHSTPDTCPTTAYRMSLNTIYHNSLTCMVCGHKGHLLCGPYSNNISSIEGSMTPPPLTSSRYGRERSFDDDYYYTRRGYRTARRHRSRSRSSPRGARRRESGSDRYGQHRYGHRTPPSSSSSRRWQYDDKTPAVSDRYLNTPVSHSRSSNHNDILSSSSSSSSSPATSSRSRSYRYEHASPYDTRRYDMDTTPVLPSTPPPVAAAYNEYRYSHNGSDQQQQHAIPIVTSYSPQHQQQQTPYPTGHGYRRSSLYEQSDIGSNRYRYDTRGGPPYERTTPPSSQASRYRRQYERYDSSGREGIWNNESTSSRGGGRATRNTNNDRWRY